MKTKKDNIDPKHQKSATQTHAESFQGDRGDARKLREETTRGPIEIENQSHGAATRGPRENDTHFHGDKEWWKTFFDDDWKRFSFDAHTAEHTSKEARFIIQALDLKPAEQVLDLCCGIGRHALELARRGFRHVIGQDFCREYLEHAASEARREGLKLDLMESDMRRIPGYGNLDAIYSWHTSFGYFEKEEENEKVMDAVGGALRQGGRFLLDSGSRDWEIRNFAAQTWHGEAPNYIIENTRFDLATSTHHGEWTFMSPDGTRKTRRMQLRQYSLHEMIELMARYGLCFVKAWGSIEGEPFTFDSRRMIVLAAKGEVNGKSIARELR